MTTGRAPASPPGGKARGETPTTLAAQCIRALLDRVAMPRHRHSAHIAELLDLSYHQAHRRLIGKAPWSLEEVQTVAMNHGETLADLFAEQKSSTFEPAVLITGQLRVTCRLWPGPPLALHRPGDLIAVKGGLEWVVMVAGDTTMPHACAIRRLVIEPTPHRARRFAILDDDSGVAQALASGLMALGYEAAAFVTEAQLEAALQLDNFDGYIIDWVLPTGTAEPLIGRLRARSASCPIALLTGKAGSKDLDETALATAIEQHGLLFLQKPVTALLAASQFSAAFATR